MAPRLVAASDPRQCVDVPERTDVECGAGYAEVVRGRVPEQMVAAPKILLDAGHRRLESRIARVDEPDFGHQQQARVESVAPEALGEGPEGRIPGPVQDGPAHRLRPLPPQPGPIPETQMRGDLRQPVARRPAHQARRRMHPGHGAQLPHPGIGLIVHREGAIAHPLEALELDAPGPRQAAGCRRTPGRRPAPRCRRHRAAHVRTPGCRPAPGPCRGSPRATRRCAR